ncbi:uncharacterized protein UBRO_20304 [Ustilago bromivora]|uniref:Uncharacterized protein n=1 Tax=Ustilago bromivora TaxID=307758 RepID=A0A1K0HI66_9BASI|nr:uncharacterized protein UBRO_20304 [Ustilago bromivora]
MTNIIKQQHYKHLCCNGELYPISTPIEVLRTCRIGPERSVQGGQPKPTRTQRSGYFHQNIPNRAYSVNLTNINQKHQTWFQARDRLQSLLPWSQWEHNQWGFKVVCNASPYLDAETAGTERRNCQRLRAWNPISIVTAD